MKIQHYLDICTKKYGDFLLVRAWGENTPSCPYHGEEGNGFCPLGKGLPKGGSFPGKRVDGAGFITIGMAIPSVEAEQGWPYFSDGFFGMEKAPLEAVVPGE